MANDHLVMLLEKAMQVAEVVESAELPHAEDEELQQLRNALAIRPLAKDPPNFIIIKGQLCGAWVIKNNFTIWTLK